MDTNNVKELLSRSALYGFFSCCFLSSWKGELENIEKHSAEVPDAWSNRVKELCILTKDISDEKCTSLFGGIGGCHDCESSYRSLPAGGMLADISGFYNAFGYPEEDIDNKPPDHICKELGYLSFMFAKEAHALYKEDTEAAETCSQARTKFIKEHLLEWSTSFVENVSENAPDSFFSKAAALMNEAVEAECSKKSQKTS